MNSSAMNVQKTTIRGWVSNQPNGHPAQALIMSGWAEVNIMEAKRITALVKT